ncbi:1,4-dihydroxy-2-naphthoate octaprenyltransferase [Psychromonas sp. 14N.309.X.WAT.B.A12]|uniref:1,4-dihydroxy-2-naphthoate octaprenyltransferase n=1 Tax=unclassified Psychromonas TaxID=2614957 RepID=UPI0025B042A7|nr:1,4-dihydroxy-2-naphthoate octaprenyltransferase [Psychromonas sp. 14N.309.X.WAT.B.A12]MDN2663516.1 1,4-dihydroxy-2-naphthoate octaprenyltransferase [Psychromonas sp. 14N.309.X.WAT.B.A12]
MNKFQVWVQACRLRTLPLAASSIIVAGGLAKHYQVFDMGIFLLSLLTALLLQVLSNLANDYGDALTGADEQRVGPQRMMQSGLISRTAMQKALIFVTFACLLSGLFLLVRSFGDDLSHWLAFIGLGIAAIIAAITYTMGKIPYGYRAMGDIAVFLFFGLLGVLGSFYLQALTLPHAILLPAVSIGLLSAAVLNINNMRDLVNDKAANKITLVVLFGRKKAFVYHLSILIAAMMCSAVYIYTLPGSQFWQFLFLLIVSPLIKSCTQISIALNGSENESVIFNEQLKNMAISTFVFSLLFSIALIT